MKISRGAIAILFTAILAMVATDVMAQRGGGGGRPGGGGRQGGGGPGGFGGGGRGGFGGGGRGGPGGGASITGLLQIQEVREEIELMPDQEDALKKLAEDRPQRGRPPEGMDFRDQSEENQAKVQAYLEKARKEREEGEKKVREQLEEILLPEQFDRLQEIEVQVLGVNALMNARVAGELKLTTVQKEKLKTASEKSREEMMAKMREMFQGGGGGGDREGMREKMEEARKAVEEKLMAVLTGDQKKDFEELKGEKFEMPEQQGRGGGRGGFGGGGRGGFGGGGGRGGAGGDRGGRGGDRGGDRGRGRPDAE